MATIKELKKYFQTHPNENIFDGLKLYASANPWCANYAENADIIDRLFIRKYYNAYVVDMGEIVDDPEDMVSILNVEGINELVVNAYKWGNLWESTILEFNPLWNVDGEVTTTRTPNLTHTEGSRTDSGNETRGAVHTTDNDLTFPFDDNSNARPTNRNEHDENAVSNSNGFTKGSQVNTETGSETTHVIRQGNIGVTETSTLIFHYRDLVNFKFWEIFFETIFANVCRFSESCDVATSSGGSSGGGGSVEVTASATANTLDAGADATANVTTNNNHLSFTFGIPRGADGVDGKDGKDGVDGKDGKDGVDGKDGKDGVDGANFELVETLTGYTPATLDFTGKSFVFFATVKNDNWVASGILPVATIKDKAFGLDYGSIIGGAGGHIGHYAKILGTSNNAYHLEYDFLNSDISNTNGCTTYVYMA